ncbi:MAG: putative PEP-CTERM system TPR-repeat lipoprotein [Gammaproteobacteria bacterium]|jgi:putative PEP-CTERM system TPR-repeat lipoprotein
MRLLNPLNIILLVSLIGSGAAPAATEPSLSGGSKSTFENAIRRMNDGEYDAAIIQLKNVLQKNPDHIPSRILLGRSYLRRGFGSSAEKELRFALKLGADVDHIFVPLGNALLLLGKYQEILDTIHSNLPGYDGGVEILTLRGRAHLELDQLDLADETFIAAAKSDRANGNPLLGRARVAVARGQLALALDHVNRAIEIDSKHAEAWYQKGDIRRVQGDFSGAIDALSRALELSPQHMRARLARSSLYLHDGAVEDAFSDATIARQNVPSDPTAAFIIWQSLLRLGRPEEARAAFVDAAKRISQLSETNIRQQPSLLRIAGFISLTKGDYERANSYLRALMIGSPNDYGMRKLLAQVQIRLGDHQSAMESLFPMRKKFPGDAELFALLGEAYMGIRRFSEASDALEHAISLTPNNPEVRKQLALSRVSVGRTDDAISELKELVEFESGAVSVGILLATLQIKNRQKAEALTTAERLVDQHPANPVVLNLLGSVLLANADRANAAAAFQNAADLDPTFVPPIFNLAQMNMESEQFERARKRFEHIISLDPRSAPALLGLADIALALDDKKLAMRTLEKAITFDRDNGQAYSHLIDLYLEDKQFPEAARLAGSFLLRNPESMEAHELSGKTKAAAGNIEDAMLSFRHAKKFAGFSGEDLLRIARAQVTIQDFQGARSTLVKATTVHQLEAFTALARLETALGNIDGGLAWANRAMEQWPEKATGHVLVAESYMKQGKFREAMKSYRVAGTREPNREAIVGLASALREAGEPAEAIVELQKWLEQYPSDIIVKRELAFSMLLNGKLDEAQLHLEQMLAVAPDNGSLLVNLARCYQLQKDHRARSVAEKARMLSPDWPVALDTLGWILVTEGDPSAGLPLLREAYSRENKPLTRFHIASALLELDRTSEAQSELKAIIELTPDVPWIADARSLYEQGNK